jgi:hypothetical protein
VTGYSECNVIIKLLENVEYNSESYPSFESHSNTRASPFALTSSLKYSLKPFNVKPDGVEQNFFVTLASNSYGVIYSPIVSYKSLNSL